MTPNVLHHVYLLTFSNGKQYVGKSMYNKDKYLDQLRISDKTPINKVMRFIHKKQLTFENASFFSCTSFSCAIQFSGSTIDASNFKTMLIKRLNTTTPNGFNTIKKRENKNQMRKTIRETNLKALQNKRQRT